MDDPDRENPEYMGQCCQCGKLSVDVFPRRMTPAEARQWDDDFREQQKRFAK